MGVVQLGSFSKKNKKGPSGFLIAYLPLKVSYRFSACRSKSRLGQVWSLAGQAAAATPVAAALQNPPATWRPPERSPLSQIPSNSLSVAGRAGVSGPPAHPTCPQIASSANSGPDR